MEEKSFKFCSNCQKEIEAKNIMLHEPFCVRNFKFCQLCKSSIEISEFDEHLQYHNIQNREPELIHDDKINPHLVKNSDNQNQNIKRLESARTECNFCELSLSLSELEQHEIMCGARSDVCQYCDKKLLVKQIKTHLETCTVKLAMEEDDMIDYLPEEDLEILKQKQIEEDERLARELMRNYEINQINQSDQNQHSLIPEVNEENNLLKRLQMELDEKLAKEIDNEAEESNSNLNLAQEEELDEDLKRIIELSKCDK